MDNDTISRQAAIEFIENVPYIKEHPNLGTLFREWMTQVIAAQPMQKTGRWIPFDRRELTEEEKQYYHDYTFMLDGPLPENDQEILVSRKGYVFVDTFFDDDGCYLDSGYEIENGMAWMPLPDAYKPKGE